MAVEALPLVTFEAYLRAEEASEEKHELYDGIVVAMAGAAPRHLRLTSALTTLGGIAFGDTTCEYLDQDTKVVVEASNSAFYPDGLIACPPEWLDDRTGAIANPTVVFEVLSPSTERKDRGKKFHRYALLPSLQDYVLISTELPLVEVFSRQGEGWFTRAFVGLGTVAHVPSVGFDLPLDALYRRIDFSVPDEG